MFKEVFFILHKVRRTRRIIVQNKEISFISLSLPIVKPRTGYQIKLNWVFLCLVSNFPFIPTTQNYVV